MTTLVNCDGCGKTIDDKGHVDFRVRAMDGNARLLFDFGPVDICSTCEGELKRHCDIKTWERPAAASASDPAA